MYVILIVILFFWILFPITKIIARHEACTENQPLTCGVAFLFSRELFAALCKRIFRRRYESFPKCQLRAGRRRREEWVRNVTFLISNYARASVRSRAENAVDSIIARPEIKTQSRWLAEFCRRVLRAPKVCRKAKHLRQMCRVRMLLNSGPLQLGSARALLRSRLMNPRCAR